MNLLSSNEEKKKDNEVWEKMGPIQSELLWFLMYKNVSSALQSLTSVDQPHEDAYVRMQDQGIFCCSELQP